VKSAVKIPVIAVGGISPDMAIRIVEEEKVDFVALGRALLADPELVVKIREGRIDEIRPCTRCNDCIDRLFSLRQFGAECSINPDVEIEKAERSKKIVVVGGGVAGMEFARVAKLRGHEVVILEKSSELGGNLIPASIPEFKSDLRNYLEWLRRQVKGVEVVLNCEEIEKKIAEIRPDAVVVAIGAEQDVPNVQGIENAVKAVDVLMGKVEVGEKVAILGRRKNRLRDSFAPCL